MRHDALNFDAEAGVGGDRGFEAFRSSFFGWLKATTRNIVDADMDELPADAARLALPCAIAGDAMADTTEFAELFDVNVDELAWMLALMATEWLCRLKSAEVVQTQPLRMRLTVAGETPVSAAILKAHKPFGLVAADPFDYKTLLRKAGERTVEATWKRIGQLLDAFTAAECANYLVNSGYASI